MLNERNWPGPGDEATWPAYAGHPSDPRYDGRADDAIERLADDMAKSPEDVLDAIGCLPDTAWPAIAAAIAQADAGALLKAFQDALAPVQWDLAQGRVEAQA